MILLGIGDWGLGIGVLGVWGKPQQHTPTTHTQKKILI